jgi:hypothetical protein
MVRPLGCSLHQIQAPAQRRAGGGEPTKQKSRREAGLFSD